MPSFYIPLSGLNADSTALNTIANNLSNMNTTAYKAQTTQFSDLFYQQVGSSGSGNAIQVGGGVKVAANSVDYTQGSYNTSGTTSSDVALDGNGFFVVSDGAMNLLTRNGAFTQDSSGNLVTSNGLSVMGYGAVNGVVNTNGALSAINIPITGDTQAPKASTTFGMTATLDSSATVGTSVPGQVEVYDSLGNSYEATVTYTKTGTNQWSYAVTLPDTLTAAAATAAAATTIPVASTATGTTTLYDFGTTATVNTGSTLKITGQTAGGTTVTTGLPTFTGTPETVADYATDLTTALNAAGIVGVSVTSTGGQLSISGAYSSISGSASQDLTATTISYNFGSSGGALATVNPSTNLTITGQTSSGATATITAPTVTSGETVAQYAAALTSALATAGISGVSVSSTAGGQLSIVGANITSSGKVIQDPVVSANATGTMTFDSSGKLVSPAADVTGITFAGLADGAATMDLSWDILGTSGTPTITQVSTGKSATSAGTQDGYASGSYQSFAIGSDGTVSATYSNGQTQAVGQLALANVTNLQGLALQGNSDYATTVASGAATIGTSGTNGLGSIQDSSLEMSNVNISAEFSNLIIAQRAFEANSKAITTFDTLTQETINMIH